jgi:hypothetical protein
LISAIPMPNATASAPTRPTYSAQFGVVEGDLEEMRRVDIRAASRGVDAYPRICRLQLWDSGFAGFISPPLPMSVDRAWTTVSDVSSSARRDLPYDVR